MLCTTVFTIHSLSTNDLERGGQNNSPWRARSLAPSSGQKSVLQTLTVFLKCHSNSVSVFLVPAVMSTKPITTADAVDVCKCKYLSLALENTTAISWIRLKKKKGNKITHNEISILFHSIRCIKMFHSGPPRVTNFTPGGFTSHYIHRKKKVLHVSKTLLTLSMNYL